MNRLIIIGASGHGRVVADIACLCGYRRIDFLDDNKSLRNCGKYKVIGPGKEFTEFVNEDTEFFVAIGDTKIRQKIQKGIEKAGGKIITLIHPNAVIAEDVQIGKGSVCMAGTVVNSKTKIGEGCIVNTSSSVDHDCTIGNYVHIAVGVHLSGTVKVGDRVWIGAGATISNNVDICKDCMIGAGTVVVRSIEKSGVYIGIPARLMSKTSEDSWENEEI